MTLAAGGQYPEPSGCHTSRLCFIGRPLGRRSLSLTAPSSLGLGALVPPEHQARPPMHSPPDRCATTLPAPNAPVNSAGSGNGHRRAISTVKTTTQKSPCAALSRTSAACAMIPLSCSGGKFGPGQRAKRLGVLCGSFPILPTCRRGRRVRPAALRHSAMRTRPNVLQGPEQRPATKL